MKRRDFLRSAGAAATIPVMPLSAKAIPVVTVPVSTAKVDWAALYARANARATPELIQKWLRVGPEQSQAIMSDLVRRRIVHAPIAGSAAAVEPMYGSSGFPGAKAASTRIVEKAKELVQEITAENTPEQVITAEKDIESEEANDETS